MDQATYAVSPLRGFTFSTRYSIHWRWRPLALYRGICYTVGRISTMRSRSAHMRAVDASSPKYAAILRLLQAWKQLPESDVARMLHDYYLVTDDFREMEDQGLLTMSFVGDEYMIIPTLLGRVWLEEYKEEKSNDK